MKKDTHVGDEELIARYIPQAKKIAFNKGQLKGDVFIPSVSRDRKKRFETSVVRYGDRSRSDMMECAHNWARSWNRSITGIAELQAKDIRKVKHLDIEHTPRKSWELLHADVIGWDLDAARQRVQAELLARTSQVIEPA